MNKFNNTCAQGDIYIRKINVLPKNVKKIEPQNGQVVVAHSETGHNHIMNAMGCQMFEEDKNPFVCYLLIEQPTDLIHVRSYDQHAPITFDKGVYEVRRQREYVPEGFRRVED